MPDLAATLLAAVREGAALALRLAEAGLDHWEKSRGDPVSEADLAIDALLKRRLMNALPDAGWLSEESADDPARLTRDRVWVVDPIDGTRDFVRARPGWAVSAALVEHGRPVLAALAAPALGHVFTASAGGGAFLNGRRLAVAPSRDGPLRIPLDASVLRGVADMVAVYKPNALALRMTMVATGEADAMLDGRGGREWDLAAAALVACEAGARVTDSHGAPLVFNKALPVFDGLVAATPAAHEGMRQRLAARRAAR